jgi:hypothetical protein
VVEVKVKSGLRGIDDGEGGGRGKGNGYQRQTQAGMKSIYKNEEHEAFFNYTGESTGDISNRVLF